MCSLTAVTGDQDKIILDRIGWMRSLRTQTNWSHDTERTLHDFSVRRTAAGCPAGRVSHDCELNGVGRKVGTCPKKLSPSSRK